MNERYYISVPMSAIVETLALFERGDIEEEDWNRIFSAFSKKYNILLPWLAYAVGKDKELFREYTIKCPEKSIGFLVIAGWDENEIFLKMSKSIYERNNG